MTYSVVQCAGCKAFACVRVIVTMCPNCSGQTEQQEQLVMVKRDRRQERIEQERKRRDAMMAKSLERMRRGRT